jgi:pimeloyl-ACP methyl ester carboxylesterase
MTELFVTTDGSAEAPPLVLIHGTAASGQSWSAMVPSLAAAHRVIRVDLPGCGSSPAPAGYDVDDQARTVGGALDELGVTSAVVAGHSSGGIVATALAVSRPSLIDAVVLINTGPSMESYIAPPFPYQPSDWPTLTDDQLRVTAAQAFRPGFDIPPEAIDQIRAMTFEAFAATSLAIRAYLAAVPLPTRLAATGKPLLVIFGEQDARWRASAAADYLAVPGAQVSYLPGSGHTPIVEDPTTTAALLLAFTAGLKN